jgi:hypothetical protein
MAAGHDRRRCRVGSGPAGKDIADTVDPYFAARFPGPGHEEIPGLPVFIGKGQPPDAATRRRAKHGHRRMGIPKAL